MHQANLGTQTSKVKIVEYWNNSPTQQTLQLHMLFQKIYNQYHYNSSDTLLFLLITCKLQRNSSFLI